MVGRVEISGIDALIERLFERSRSVREQINAKLNEHIAPLEDDLSVIFNELEYLKSLKRELDDNQT